MSRDLIRFSGVSGDSSLGHELSKLMDARALVVVLDVVDERDMLD